MQKLALQLYARKGDAKRDSRIVQPRVSAVDVHYEDFGALISGDINVSVYVHVGKLRACTRVRSSVPEGCVPNT